MLLDLENKIRWESLAPSLQDLFRFNDSFNIMLNRIIQSGDDGQILKINTKTLDLYADDNFRNNKTIISDSELASMKNIALSNLSFISNWKELYTSTTNASYNSPTNFKYENGYIVSKTQATHGYIYTDKEYNINANIVAKIYNTTTISGSYAGIIISSITYNGIIHDISVVFDGNTIRIILDAFSSTDNKLVLYEYETKETNTTWSSSSYCFMKVKKEYGYIHVWVSKLNSNNFDYEFIYELPYAQSSDMNFTQYTALYKLLRSNLDNSYVGFGCSNFIGNILPMYGLTDNDDLIYDIENNKLYYYENGTWNMLDKIADGLLPQRSFIYNPYLNKLYWYKFASSYYILNTSNSNLTLPSSLTGCDNGYTARVNTDGTVFLDSMFKTLKFATNNTEKNTMMSYTSGTDSKYDSQDLYVLHENKVYTFSSSSGWVYKDTVSNLLSNYTHIYNPFLKIFYFYANSSDYTKIIAR